MAKAKPFYSILYLPEAKRLCYYNRGTLVFKTEEEAYKHLLKSNFASRRSDAGSLQILLLISALSKIDEDIAYKIFLADKNYIKTFNGMTVMAYLNKNKMFKVAFKAYCDAVAIKGLGASRNTRVCFEYYEVTEHPAGTDPKTI